MDIKQNRFLSFRFDSVNENIEVFKTFYLKDKNKIILKMLEYNNLYVNYSEIDDAIYNMSKENKKLNKEILWRYQCLKKQKILLETTK